MAKDNKEKERGYYKPLSMRLGEEEKQELKNLMGKSSWNILMRSFIDDRREKLNLTKIKWNKNEKRKEAM